MRKAGMFELKIIHWSYIKSNDDLTDVQLSFKPQIVVKPGTATPNGVLIKFPIKIFKGGELTLNCIAEQVFIHDEITSFNFEETKFLLQTTTEEFNDKFEDKYLKETGLHQRLLKPPTDIQVTILMEYLQAKR